MYLEEAESRCIGAMQSQMVTLLVRTSASRWNEAECRCNAISGLASVAISL